VQPDLNNHGINVVCIETRGSADAVIARHTVYRWTHVAKVLQNSIFSHTALVFLSGIQDHGYYYKLIACCAYATSMTSVSPSVTLVDCYHVVQQKVEIGT